MTIRIEISKKSKAELCSLNVHNWPVWTCEKSEFPWEYSIRESCYILEGLVEVSAEKETVRFGAGDYVVFPKGLKCRWKVIEPVKKHYQMG